MKRLVSLLLFMAMILSLAACGDINGDADTGGGSSSLAESLTQTEPTDESEPEADKTVIDIEIGDAVLTATLADNSSAKEFAGLLGEGEITVEMHDYGSFEKVGSLPRGIVRNDEQITTEPGDIILYQGNQITIYYDTNSWNFTRLGKIDDVSQAELKALLGEGDVSATFRLHK